MRQIKHILVALSIIIVTLISIDYFFGKVTNHWFFSSVKTKFIYAMKSKETPDIVFFGSSKAENNYDTPFIMDSLKINVLNMGEAGRGLTYHCAAIKSYLRNHTPKIIVLDLLPDDLSGQINNRIKPLYPYMNTYPDIRDVAYKVDPCNKYLLKSNLLMYNSEIFEHIKHYRHPYKPTSLGFTALKIRNSYQTTQQQEISPPIYINDEIAKKCLFEIIEVCRSHDIKLIIAYSPELYIRNYKLSITSICDSLNVPLADFRDFKDKNNGIDYFYDNRHLNKIGAREYTRAFMEFLKKEKFSEF